MDARLHAWVADALTRGWTPELIEGRLKLEYPADPSMRIRACQVFCVRGVFGGYR
jgi:hypothetical protein